eukprot:GHVR01047932.1.p1 GENE.GHVR01047932.1~~GHVR01047932.1.p1  ORF type:complete len:122 (-),score=24.47 GHVR01047932.1:573-938(-)
MNLAGEVSDVGIAIGTTEMGSTAADSTTVCGDSDTSSSSDAQSKNSVAPADRHSNAVGSIETFWDCDEMMVHEPAGGNNSTGVPSTGADGIDVHIPPEGDTTSWLRKLFNWSFHTPENISG